MAPFIPDENAIKSFRSEQAFESWLSKNHARATEIWLRVFKKSSGVASITHPQAIDVALCWGWIDGIRKSLDEQSYLQRFTPRRAKSSWSQINRDHVARLVAAGRMTPHGQRQVDAAKQDGRWDAAYAPMRAATVEGLPEDLLVAIEANAQAKKVVRTLSRADLFSLTFHTTKMRTAAGRARKVEELVAMLARGEAPALGTPSGAGLAVKPTPKREK